LRVGIGNLHDASGEVVTSYITRTHDSSAEAIGPSSTADNKKLISRLGMLVYIFCWKYAQRSCIDQRLHRIGRIKDHRPLNSRDATLISTGIKTTILESIG